MDPAIVCATLTNANVEFADRLVAFGLAGWWDSLTDDAPCRREIPGVLAGVLGTARHQSTARYLAQRSAILDIDRLFSATGIPYAVIKGAAVRERVYKDPSSRPSADVDILVAPDRRDTAVRLLGDAGYRPTASSENISHEICLSGHSVDIDLHWDVLRPGRVPGDIVTELLAGRRRCRDHWTLSDDDTLFLMLVHPAFTKYVCSYNLSALQVADFLLWVQRVPVQWPHVVSRLRSSGTATAAWAMLEWYRALAPTSVAEMLNDWQRDVAPGSWRQRYLRHWIANDLPNRWLERALLVQAGFTLFLHDGFRHAARAVAGWWRSRSNRQQELSGLLGNAPHPGTGNNRGSSV